MKTLIVSFGLMLLIMVIFANLGDNFTIVKDAKKAAEMNNKAKRMLETAKPGDKSALFESAQLINDATSLMIEFETKYKDQDNRDKFHKAYFKALEY